MIVLCAQAQFGADSCKLLLPTVLAYHCLCGSRLLHYGDVMDVCASTLPAKSAVLDVLGEYHLLANGDSQQPGRWLEPDGCIVNKDRTGFQSASLVLLEQYETSLWWHSSSLSFHDLLQMDTLQQLAARFCLL